MAVRPRRVLALGRARLVEELGWARITNGRAPAPRPSHGARSDAAISANVPPRWTVAGAAAALARPRDRPVERPVELERGRRRAGTQRRVAGQPRDARELARRDVAEDDVRARQLVDAARRDDLAAERRSVARPARRRAPASRRAGTPSRRRAPPRRARSRSPRSRRARAAAPSARRCPAKSARARSVVKSRAIARALSSAADERRPQAEHIPARPAPRPGARRTARRARDSSARRRRARRRCPASARSSVTASPSSACAAGTGGSIQSTLEPSNAGDLPRERQHRRADVVAEARQRQLGRAAAAADRLPRLVHGHLDAGLRELHRAREPVRPGADRRPRASPREPRPGQLVLDRQPVDAAEQRPHLRRRARSARRTRSPRASSSSSRARAARRARRRSPPRSARSAAARTATRRTRRPTARSAVRRSAPTARAAVRAPRPAAAARSPTSASWTIASPPRGRSTRAISAIAARASNQWNASPTNTASTLASSSGIASAEPARTSPSRISARIASFGSTATTCANRRASSLVSRPVPAARSSTRASRAERERRLRAVEHLLRVRTAGRGGTSRRRCRSSVGAADRPRDLGRASEAYSPGGQQRRELARAPRRDRRASRSSSTDAANASTSSRLLTCSWSTASSCSSPNGNALEDVLVDSGRAFARRAVRRAAAGTPPAAVTRRAVVPEQREHAARPKHARDLRDRDVVREPVERLAGEDAVDLAVAERDLLRARPRARPLRERAPRGSRAARRAARRRSTCAYRSASARVSLPVPAPRSSTVASSSSGSRSKIPGGQPGGRGRTRRLRDESCAPARLSRRPRAGTRGSPSASRARSRGAGSGSCPRRSA